MAASYRGHLRLGYEHQLTEIVVSDIRVTYILLPPVLADRLLIM